MILKFTNNNPIKNAVFILGFATALSGLSSCDSSSDIPVQQVDNQQRFSDTELQEQQKQLKAQLQQSNGQSLNNTFKFGFDLRSSPQEDAAQYLPFLTYLENVTGYRFKLSFTPKSSTTADELGQNNTQFAAIGATSYLTARSQYNVISIARGINHQGKAEYQSFFVARPNSRIRNINDIRGRKLAFGSKDSTQGHLIPRIMLTENNISLKDLRSYHYTGSHQNCAEAVVSGKYDVCGMQDQLAEKLSAQGLIKIIHRSSYYPSSGIAANKSVPTEVIKRVTQALLNFDPQGKHQQGLYNWDRTEMPRGFVAAEESDYVDLNKWSIRLGFVEQNPVQVQ